jgi:uncharacterized protein YcgI (DUF1989 family)
MEAAKSRLDLYDSILQESFHRSLLSENPVSLMTFGQSRAGRHMTIAGGYKGFVLRLRRDKTARTIEIFGPACSDFVLSTAASVAEAKRWIDEYIDLEQTIDELVYRKKGLDTSSTTWQQRMSSSQWEVTTPRPRY